MKVLVTGATGFVGNTLLKELKNRGHDIVVISRDREMARVRLPVFCEVHECDLNATPPSLEALEGVEAVIHLAGENIGAGRWTRSRKKKIFESRKNATHHLVRAMLSLPALPRVLVSASAIGYYGDRGNEWIDETSPAGEGFLTRVCQEWEKETQPARMAGVRTVNYRLGVVLGFDGGAIERMWAPFQLGFGGTLGSGKQWMSWIHVQDLARALVYAVETERVDGCYNAVSPTPATNLEFTKSLEKVMDQQAPFPVPALILKTLLGEMSQILLDSQRVSCQKLLDTGFQFNFPELSSALGEIGSHLHHEIQFEQWIPAPSSKAFAFFENPKNVERVTPPSLDLTVDTSEIPELRSGAQVPLRFSILGLPIHWITRIKDWEPNLRFTDTQIQGPFSVWNHTHEFESRQGGTLIRDKIEYRLPLGVLGDLLAGSWVRRELEKTLSYRIEKMKSLTH